MNVYDFDKTIYEGDSTIDFYLFCLKKYPQILKYFPKQILGMLKYKMKSINKTQFKEDFFSFLREIPDVKKEVRIFWKRKKKKIKKWYIEQRKPDDVIISASPEYLLKEICDELEIKYLIASKVEEKTGKFMGIYETLIRRGSLITAKYKISKYIWKCRHRKVLYRFVFR